jgi:iron complex outermembrane receptor protein
VQLKVAPFFTYVKDYINAVPNMSSNPYNMSGLMGRQSLTFANQDARLYGIDISGRTLLGRFHGEWTVRLALDYTRGRTSGGDNLYNIMPLNARLAIEHALGAWSNTLEAVVVSAKDNLSAVRAEQATAGYSLVSYRTSYSFGKSLRLDAGIDNAFNRQYDLPLGGLEYVSGGMMSAPRPLRAMGRSVNVGMSVSY